MNKIETTECLHEIWTVTRGENGVRYELVSGPFILTVFYADEHDYSYVIWNNDDDQAEDTYSSVNDIGHIHQGLYGLFANTLYALDKIEDEYREDCEDAAWFSGAFDSESDYDDVADDYMRADSDLWDEC